MSPRKPATLVAAGVVILALIAMRIARPKSDLLSTSEFTAAAIPIFQSTNPGLKFDTIDDLHLKITTGSGKTLDGYLDNTYNAYKQNPSSLDAVLRRYATSLADVSAMREEFGLQRDRIIASVKTHDWLAGLRSNASSGKPIAVLTDDLNSELVVAYGEDLPNSIRSFGEEELAKAGIARSELRALAQANLKQRLPNIQRHGENGYYMYTADGTYEASLILLDHLWTPEQCPVDGKIVFAIPTRDVLLVTGSRSSEGIARLKEAVKKLSSNAPYQLSQQLFVRRDGRIDLFDPSSTN